MARKFATPAPASFHRAIDSDFRANTAPGRYVRFGAQETTSLAAHPDADVVVGVREVNKGKPGRRAPRCGVVDIDVKTREAKPRGSITTITGLSRTA